METAGGRALTPARGTLLRVRRSSKLAAAGLAATASSFAALALDIAGVRVPGALTRALALVALPFAFALAVRTCAAIWRGPALVHFPVELSVPCRGTEAEFVRMAASVRGALGGAGHVFKARLVLPLIAWAAAAVVLNCASLGEAHGPACRVSLQILAVAVAARFVFPARPFWYREWRDGSVVLYPPSVMALVSERSQRSKKD